MAESPDVHELVEGALDSLLLDEITKHVPDDERVGVVGSAYWIGYSGPGEVTPASSTGSRCSPVR